MSLETLLKAARYVEQQELHAKHQQQQHRHHSPVQQHFKIVSPLPLQLAAGATPPTAVVSPVSFSVLSSPAPAALPNGLPVRAGLPLTQPVVEVLPKPPQAYNTQSPPSVLIATNGFEKYPTLDSAQVQHDPSKKQRNNSTSSTSSLSASQHGSGVIRSGTREVHNKLEKNRRAHLKECFEVLKKQLPLQQDEKKISNLSILHSAVRYIQTLKKKERENEHEMERLAREKISAQQRLAALKKELSSQWDNVDFNSLLIPSPPPLPLPAPSSPPACSPDSAVSTQCASGSPVAPAIGPAAATPAQLSVHLPLPQTTYPVGQGLVVGLHKVALVSKNLPVTHIIAAQPQINGKMMPIVNAQYVMKPVVMVSTSTPSTAATTLSPRSS